MTSVWTALYCTCLVQPLSSNWPVEKLAVLWLFLAHWPLKSGVDALGEVPTTVKWSLYPIYKNTTGYLYAAGIALYWWLYGLYWRVYEALMLLGYPLRKLYWVADYQFQRRVRPLLRGRAP
jgi:hypothetical protein